MERHHIISCQITQCVDGFLNFSRATHNKKMSMLLFVNCYIVVISLFVCCLERAAHETNLVMLLLIDDYTVAMLLFLVVWDMQLIEI